MKLKKINLVLAVFIVVATFAYAQEWPNAADIVEKARTELNLDQSQFDRVKVIIEDNMAKRIQVVEDSPNGVTPMSVSQRLGTELYTRLSEVLSESQMTKWDRVLGLIEKDMQIAQLQHGKIEPTPEK